VISWRAPFVKDVENPTGCEWQTSDLDEIRKFLSDPLCAKPFSNSMTYSVIKGFHDLWLPENEARVPLDLPILFIAGPLFAYVRDRRAVRPDGSRQPVSGKPRRARVAVDRHGILTLARKNTETKALRGVGAR